MGVNSQTTVPSFTASQILTAEQMNQSARTGVPVFANTAARDAAFGGTGEKTLAEGQLCYVEGTGLQTYNAAGSWVTWGTAPSTAGLELISATNIGSAVSSVQVTNAFSATYDAYKIIITGGASSANDRLEMILGATTTGYSMQFIYGSYTNAVSGAGSTNQAKWLYAGGTSTTSIAMDVDLLNPYLTEFTFISSRVTESSLGGIGAGYLNNSTSYTDFTISPKTGTITGGTIRVYGYKN